MSSDRKPVVSLRSNACSLLSDGVGLDLDMKQGKARQGKAGQV
jgi:hypothetical protein